MYERVKQNSQKPTEKQIYNESQSIRLALVFMWNKHYGKGFIAIFRDFFASIN